MFMQPSVHLAEVLINKKNKAISAKKFILKKDKIQYMILLSKYMGVVCGRWCVCQSVGPTFVPLYSPQYLTDPVHICYSHLF